MDPYLLLEVPDTASIDDIKKAYRRLAKKWHPDTNGGSTHAADMFKKIQAAYACLIDPAKRAAEDMRRKHQEQMEALKKSRSKPEPQNGAATDKMPTVSKPGDPNWGAWGLAILAFVGIGVALSQDQASRSRSRSKQRNRRRTR